MWKTIKNIYNRLSLIILAVALILFLFFLIFTLIVEGFKGKPDSIIMISIFAIILSFPGMVNALVDEFNPKKKTYKLSCRCPKCKYLIQMDMKEE
ncbi:hypothetical protein H7992_13270 [Sporosarcina sp. resist]|uniref:hypothetical protein n=1 Tax=Sporosarcina TaxID=1569 RepID=UPI00078C43A5|nr:MULTISPECIES: hypothetical protein [Sporosarcina]AMQ06530.1 hypothetical protein AZE41_11660 [Sporosarcina psychrophila]QNK86244.1 hypothetical protein H7992_13270 [Sporosarcina sp. resist]